MASYNTVITNEGAALLASVIANQGTLTFSEMRFSTTDYDGVEATLTVGTFAGVFITAAASASVVDSTTIKVGAQFDNSGIVGDHPLYSIGIVGTDGNTTALIAVCTTTNPDIIRAALTGVSTYAFNVNLAVSSTLNITVAGTTAAVLYDIDVVDTLISTATDKPLSANQGRVLKGNIDDNFSGQSNENIFNNPFFTQNQKGTSGSYQTGYMADRWVAYGLVGSNITTNITNNGAVIQSDGTQSWRVLQNIEKYKDLSGREVTYSINVKSISSSYVALFYAPSPSGLNNDWVYLGNASTTGITSVTFTLPDLSSASGLCLMFQSEGPIDATIRSVKLEVGSISTLANDIMPNIDIEQIKCRRYFLRMESYCGIGIALNSTDIYLFVPTESLRIGLPTISFSGTIDFLGANTYTISNVLLYGVTTQGIALKLVTSGLTAGECGAVIVNAGAYIDIDANI